MDLKSNVKRYAFFDFDGTLIAKDSFLILLRQGLRTQPWRALFLLPVLPIVLATYVFKLDRTLIKSLLLWSLTFGRTRKGSVRFLNKTMEQAVDSLWFTQAVPVFNALIDDQVEIVVVSASGQMWVRSALRQKFAKFKCVIGSRLGFCWGGVILTSKNCYKAEKLARIEEALGTEFTWHSAWSDHVADIPMLKQAPLRYLICPRDKHMAQFSERLQGQFQVCHWTTKMEEKKNDHTT